MAEEIMLNVLCMVEEISLPAYFVIAFVFSLILQLFGVGWKQGWGIGRGGKSFIF